jgi:hypothetical protein
LGTLPNNPSNPGGYGGASKTLVVK